MATEAALKKPSCSCADTSASTVTPFPAMPQGAGLAGQSHPRSRRFDRQPRAPSSLVPRTPSDRRIGTADFLRLRCRKGRGWRDSPTHVHDDLIVSRWLPLRWCHVHLRIVELVQPIFCDSEQFRSCVGRYRFREGCVLLLLALFRFLRNVFVKGADAALEIFDLVRRK